MQDLDSYCNATPFFLRFQQELVHHEKSALSNPAQLLRLLTGQERLHHPFVLVARDASARKRNNGGAASAATTAKGGRSKAIREALTAERTSKAIQRETEYSDEGVWALLPKLLDSRDLAGVSRLLLDILLGTGRSVDDLRKISNVKKAFSADVKNQLEVLTRAVHHVAAALRWWQPLQVELRPEDLDGLCTLCAKGAESKALADVTKRWTKHLALREDLAGIGLKGRELLSLRFPGLEPILLDTRQHPSKIAKELEAQQYHFYKSLAAGKGSFWRAEFSIGPRGVKHVDLDSLLELATHLVVLVDIVQGDDFAQLHTVALLNSLRDARSRAFDVLLRADRARGISRGETEILLDRCGEALKGDAQLQDPRVPWPVDPWQRELLDAVDAGAGAVVLAPTSAGKTFAAYYVMEHVLRSSNTAAVLVTVPTVPLASQIEAEVYARFGQKPYPHDGFSLCAALVPGRPRHLARTAQILVATPEEVAHALNDEALWDRIVWVIADEIHMQPLSIIKTLARRCGGPDGATSDTARKPFLAMSATIQDPESLARRLAGATQSPDFRLVRHDERTVDLHTHWWDSHAGRVVPLHPLLLLRLEEWQCGAALPRMAPQEALRLCEALRTVAPGVAAHVAPDECLQRGWSSALAAEHLPNTRMPTRQEFRVWERRLASCVRELPPCELVKLQSHLNSGTSSGCSTTRASAGDLQSRELLRLLGGLRSSKMLPCLCFHRSPEASERFLLGLAQLLEDGEEAKKEAHRTERRKLAGTLRAAWKAKVDELQEELEVAEELARKRLRWQSGARASEDDERCPETRAEDDTEAVQGPDRAAVSRDAAVQVLRTTLQSLIQAGPPDGVFLKQEFSFVSERSRHTYMVEVRLLMAHVEAGIKGMAKQKGKRWTQAVSGALRRGFAMHFHEDGMEGLNFAVQLLFRMGHVQVLFAGEALGCGVNLPCRTVVILDSEIQGARLQQMAGRAGRRGLDLVGHTVFVQDLSTLQSMRSPSGSGAAA